MEAYILCLRCRATLTEDDCKGHSSCPRCGNSGVPADAREKATLTLTHHEWRVLFIWATNWAEQVCSKEQENNFDAAGVMASLVREARRQDPSLSSLTLMEDVQEAVNLIGQSAEIHDCRGVTKVEPEKRH